MRLYIFGVTLIGFLFFLWRSIKTARDGSSALFTWVMRLAALFLLVVFIAEIIGQTVFAMQGMVDGVVPPTINYTPDPEMILDCVPEGARGIEQEFLLKNAFGFGGCNASIVLKRLN